MEFKKCNSCLEIKNIVCFYTNNNNNTGYKGICKDFYIKKVKIIIFCVSKENIANNNICDYCKLEKNDFYFNSK